MPGRWLRPCRSTGRIPAQATGTFPPLPRLRIARRLQPVRTGCTGALITIRQPLCCARQCSRSFRVFQAPCCAIRFPVSLFCLLFPSRHDGAESLLSVSGYRGNAHVRCRHFGTDGCFPFWPFLSGALFFRNLSSRYPFFHDGFSPKTVRVGFHSVRPVSSTRMSTLPFGSIFEHRHVPAWHNIHQRNEMK